MMVSTLSLLALVLTVGTDDTPPVRGEPALIEFLKGALVSNRAELEQGHAKFLVEYRYEALRKRWVIEQEADWDGPRARLSMRYIDPEHSVAGRSFTESGFAERPFDRILIDEAEVRWYVPEQGLVRVLPNRSPLNVRTANYNLLPVDRWFRTNVPYPDGATIDEQIVPDERQAKFTDHYEVFRRGREIIWRSHHLNGVVLELVFSTECCTNLTSFVFTKASRPSLVRKGTYKWIKSGPACRLAELEISETIPDHPTEFNYTYKLKVLHYSRNVESKAFSPTRYFHDLPPKTRVEDSVRGTTYMINNGGSLERDKVKDWNRFIELVRRNGFLAK